MPNKYLHIIYLSWSNFVCIFNHNRKIVFHLVFVQLNNIFVTKLWISYKLHVSIYKLNKNTQAIIYLPLYINSVFIYIHITYMSFIIANLKIFMQTFQSCTKSSNLQPCEEKHTAEDFARDWNVCTYKMKYIFQFNISYNTIYIYIYIYIHIYFH